MKIKDGESRQLSECSREQEMMLSNALSTVWSQNVSEALLSLKPLIFTIDVSRF